jgi:ribonuclease HI
MIEFSFGYPKLNFDGSFLPSIRRGGDGGVVRGRVVRSYLGPLESMDANEAKVFALLVGLP